ncbi:hypothetical protein CY35_18G062100 [Sphagnum magellanicum]|nr:hypothetical protein CY35_18G062100 [Sphagnum magellanicum]
MAAAQVRKGVIGPWRQYSRPFIVVSLGLLRFKDGGAVLGSNIDSSSRRRRELEVVADMDSEREPPSAAEIFDDLIHASSSEGFTYPSFARCHRAGNVSECQGCRVGSCWSEQIFGSLDLSSNYEVISVGATKKWTQKAQRLKKGGQGFCEGRIQARSWRVLNSYRFDFLSRANPIQECSMQRRPFSSSGVDVRDFIGKGAAAVAEIDRLADHTDPDDHRLKPLLKAAKENFELALEVDKHNTYAMLALARLHLYYEIPGACLLRVTSQQQQHMEHLLQKVLIGKMQVMKTPKMIQSIVPSWRMPQSDTRRWIQLQEHILKRQLKQVMIWLLNG